MASNINVFDMLKPGVCYQITVCVSKEKCLRGLENKDIWSIREIQIDGTLGKEMEATHE